MKDIHLKDIKKDQIFYERDYGMMLKGVALEDAYISGKLDGIYTQWKCRVELFETGEEFELLTTENHEHYGPKLYVGTPDSAKAEWKVTKLFSKNAVSENNLRSETVFVGELMVEPEVGGILFVMETNGMMLRTSKIIEIEKMGDFRIIQTRNSKYKLEKL